MNISKNDLIRSYLSNLNIQVMLSGCNEVLKDWRDIDYIPEYNKFNFM